MMPGMVPGITARPPKVLTYRTNLTESADLSSKTYSSVAIGDAAPDRYVIVGAGGSGGSGIVTAITIGGVSATILQNHAVFGANNMTAALAIALVPTGTTADIVVTYGTTKGRQGIGVWTATGLLSATPHDSDKASVADPISVTLDTVLGGFCVAYVHGIYTDGTGWSNVTQRFTDVFDSGDHTGADAATTGASITPSFDSTTSNMCIVAATF